MTEKEDIESKLLDYFLGELSREEAEDVLHRVESDETYRELFCQVRAKYLKMRWGARAELVRGEVSRVKQVIRKRRIVRWATRVAAILVVLFGVGILWMKSETENVNVVENKTDTLIVPGKSQAFLYLSTGESVLLAKGKREMREDHGVSIMVNADGEIRYDASKKNNATASVFNRLVVPRGGEYVVTLEDGTKVWLDAGTELRYPTNFNGKERTVYLQGEAFFDVARMEDKPFVVRVDRFSINVLGTKFNVNTRMKNIVQTVLVEGRVRLKSNEKQVELIPNQKAEYHRESGKWTVEEVDVTPYIAWKDGNFVFDDESLEEIMNKLSFWYDVEVGYANESIKSVRLSGDMKRYKDIRELLYFFERISDVKFIINGKNITVSYK